MGKKENIIATKLVPLAFEGTLGLRINFHKSSIICKNTHGGEASMFAFWMNNNKDSIIPFTYLGLPLCDRKLLKQCWLALLEKINLRFESWKGRLLCYCSSYQDRQ